MLLEIKQVQELKEGMLVGGVVKGGGEQSGEKERDNCNSIINKIHLKKDIKQVKKFWNILMVSQP